MSDQTVRAAPLSRLLGPAAEEVTCERCFELIDEYVGLELAGLDADAALPGMGPHLEGCPACRDDHDSLRTLVAAERGSESPAPRAERNAAEASPREAVEAPRGEGEPGSDDPAEGRT
jgi:hypothetical protein